MTWCAWSIKSNVWACITCAIISSPCNACATLVLNAGYGICSTHIQPPTQPRLGHPGTFACVSLNSCKVFSTVVQDTMMCQWHTCRYESWWREYCSVPCPMLFDFIHPRRHPLPPFLLVKLSTSRNVDTLCKSYSFSLLIFLSATHYILHLTCVQNVDTNRVDLHMKGFRGTSQNLCLWIPRGACMHGVTGFEKFVNEV